MAKHRHTARLVVAWVLGIYAVILVLLNLPFVQQKMAAMVADALTEKLGTKVSIGSVNVGFLNHLIINDLEAVDQKGEMMLHVGRVSATVDILNTVRGQITIPSAQLFSATAHIYKECPDSALNIQYVIDAFSSKEKKEPSKLNLRINTLLVRHANVTYDVKSLPVRTGKFDVNHIDTRNVGFDLSLKPVTNDSINVTLKRFSAIEYNSGLYVKDLALHLNADKQHADLTDFTFSSTGTSIQIPELDVDYTNFKKDKSFQLNKDLSIAGTISPADFSCFLPSLEEFTDSYSLQTEIEGGSDNLHIKNFTLASKDNQMQIDCNATVRNLTQNESLSVDANINKVSATNASIRQLLSLLSVDESKVKPLLNAGDITLIYKVHYDKSLVKANGQVTTDAGALDIEASYDKDKHLVCDIATMDGKDINLGKILDNEKLGDIAANVKADVTFVKGQKIPSGTIAVDIPKFDYNGYSFSNISLDAKTKGNSADVNVDIDDDNASLAAHALYSLAGGQHDIDLTMNVESFNPKALHLLNNQDDEIVSFAVNGKVHGSNLNNLNGNIDINDLTLYVPDTIYNLDNLEVKVHQETDGKKNIEVNSDFVYARLKGKGQLSDIVNDFKGVLASNMSQLIHTGGGKSDATYEYDVYFMDSPILHHFIKEDYEVEHPVRIIGTLDAAHDVLNIDVDAPMIRYGNSTYRDVSVVCCNNKGQMSVKGSGLTYNGNSAMKVGLNAVAHNSIIDSDIKLKMKNQNDIDVDMKSTVSFCDSLGKTKTMVDIHKADLLINDTLWNVNPAQISIYQKDIACHGLKMYSGDKFLSVEGMASPDPSDSIVAKLNNIEIEYVLNLVNFTAVDFSGIASGEAVVKNLNGKPYFDARLNVKDFAIEGGILGNAKIHGFWNDEVNGIGIDASMVDLYKCQDGLTSKYIQRFGETKVKGYVSPANNYIDLKVDAMDTHAAVLEGYLGIIFKNIDGYLRGNLNVVGPLNQIDLIGDITGDMAMTLKATNVPYRINGDTIRLRSGSIGLDNVRILDAYNNAGILTGQVTHNHLRNFGYAFDADARQILVYDEKEFNENKFKATVFASGTLHVDGSDGHPLNISGNLTPTRGSVFAYDNVSPDALANSNFITFRDITFNGDEDVIHPYDKDEDENANSDDLSKYIVKKEKKKSNYEGDIYMDFHMNLNPNCEVKLRMDRMDDAYISAFGNGVLQAKWHNKGTFELFGTYNVERGSYRLYMHDLVYRDLSLQQGSSVAFNGNPFDAGIHLICNHEIHNVPLSDLTSTTAYTQNNKVKVVCVLDISGTISNMDFKFDLSLPSSSDETRQLVKSMINSDEEMNTQMIYLLAVGRFYPNDFARANGDFKSGQAVNSFVSSTLSGQINQVLSSIIGTNSNWNFGTGISTGEKGWQDMDVEGILSGRLFNERLLINGNFGYRDNALTNTASFIGDFELKWRVWENKNTYLKAYNMTNDRYFTKGTLNTQGLGVSFQHDFESFKYFFGHTHNEDEGKTGKEDVKAEEQRIQEDEAKKGKNEEEERNNNEK